MATPTSKEILQSMGTKPTFGLLGKELGEVVDAAINLDASAVLDEIGDAAFFAWALAALHGINLPAVGTSRCWAKVEARRQVWRRIFEAEGLEYHPRYTAGGTNYEKSGKVEMALAIARSEQWGS